MSKSLKLVVRGAGIFADPRLSHTGDRIFRVGETKSLSREKDSPYINVPSGMFDYRHIANLLRVLCGERPVPSIRKVMFTGDSLFEDMARRCRVKIVTPILDGPKKTKVYPKEALTPRKAVGDSWKLIKTTYNLDGNPVEVKGGCLSWDRLKRSLGLELYSKFQSLILKYGGAPTGKEGIELLNKNKEEKDVQDFCEICIKNSNTSLSNIILNTKPESVTFHANTGCKLNLLMAQQGAPEEIEKVDAMIYVPLTEEELCRFSKGTGAATFLEGGMVYIDGVDDWSPVIDSIGQLPVEGEMLYVSDILTVQ